MPKLSSDLGSALYELVRDTVASDETASPDIVRFFEQNRVVTLDDRKLLLEQARQLADARIVESNQEDELAFEAFAAINVALLGVRDQIELRDFMRKYSGRTFEQAFVIDLAERQAAWQQALAEEQKLFAMILPELREHFRFVGDGLGLGIDAGIMETVVALTANGIPTTSSCEGHSDRGLAYPWVAIGHRQPPKFLRGQPDPLKDELEELNLPVFRRVERLLDEFYAQRTSAVVLQLTDNRLMPDVQGDHRREDLLEPRQAEMRAFTAFLLRRAEQAGK